MLDLLYSKDLQEPPGIQNQSIMKKIVKRNGDVFTERVQLSKTEKMILAAYVYVRFRFIGL